MRAQFSFYTEPIVPGRRADTNWLEVVSQDRQTEVVVYQSPTQLRLLRTQLDNLLAEIEVKSAEGAAEVSDAA